MPDHTPRLTGHRVLRTTDFDVAREEVGRVLRPHRLDLAGSARSVDLEHNVAELDRVAFHYIDYGAEVQVTVDELDFLLVQIPLAGCSTVRTRREEVVATSSVAAVAPTNEPVRMSYGNGNPRLMVRIDRNLIETRIAQLTGGPGHTPVAFRMDMDLTEPATRSWLALVDYVVRDFEAGRALTTSPTVAKTLELAVTDGLLVAQPHTRSAAFAEPALAVSPRVVRRAAALIDQHCAEPLTTPDIAEAVGVATRSLQAGFRRHLDTSPMAYLRRTRLIRVHDELAAGTAKNVTETAVRWGVTHLGRFARDYRRLFGESPSETARRGA